MKLYFSFMLERVLILNADHASKNIINLFKSSKNCIFKNNFFNFLWIENRSKLLCIFTENIVGSEIFSKIKFVDQFLINNLPLLELSEDQLEIKFGGILPNLQNCW